MTAMVDTEREMLREKDESGLGERKPFESSRQATYEDTLQSDRDAEHDDWD
jgi:hypothetical protein